LWWCKPSPTLRLLLPGRCGHWLLLLTTRCNDAVKPRAATVTAAAAAAAAAGLPLLAPPLLLAPLLLLTALLLLCVRLLLLPAVNKQRGGWLWRLLLTRSNDGGKPAPNICLWRLLLLLLLLLFNSRLWR
jgi:hypothetical protein